MNIRKIIMHPVVDALIIAFLIGLVIVLGVTKANADGWNTGEVKTYPPATLQNCKTFDGRIVKIPDPYVYGQTINMRFNPKLCNVKGMRLLKESAKGQKRIQRLYDNTSYGASKSMPIIVCGFMPSGVTTIKPAFGYLPSIKHRNKAERNFYALWAKNYAQKHGCNLAKGF